MSDSTLVKDGLIPVGVQMMSAWLVNDWGGEKKKKKKLPSSPFKLHETEYSTKFPPARL